MTDVLLLAAGVSLFGSRKFWGALFLAAVVAQAMYRASHLK